LARCLHGKRRLILIGGLSLRIEAVHPRELGAGDVAAWESLRSANGSLTSPYYSGAFARLMGEVRPDARVAVLMDGTATVGYLGVQGMSRFAALGLGTPLSDYQGLVAEPRLIFDHRDLCRALRVGRVDMVNVPLDQSAFAGALQGAQASWVADLSMGPLAYLERMRERRQETVRQQDRKRRKLMREHPDVVFHACSTSREHLTALLEWKTDQCRRTGQPLVWATPWVREVVYRSFDSQDPSFGGVLFTMTRGDTLVAAHYLLRSGSVLHAWLIGHDGGFEAYSPGVLLTRFLVEWAANNGFVEVDFGIGDYRYKREFAEPLRQLGWGTIGQPSWSLALRSAQYRARAILERAPVEKVASAPGKLMRRVDVLRGLAAPAMAGRLPIKEHAS
jgi:CelD/BcsL family acetyltransferase involved in cellulose biosynthesis